MIDYDHPVPCDACHTALATVERDGDALCPTCSALRAQIASMARVRAISARHAEATADIEDATLAAHQAAL
jgi:uncharacterized Zn finger protein (UPF0148 family)